MKIADISFPHDDKFQNLKRLILGKPYPEETEETLKLLRKLIRRAEDTDDLIRLILASDELRGTRTRANIIRFERPDMIWKEIRAAFGDGCVKTESDAGGVKVGNDAFSFIVPNGRGDGTTRVRVFDETPEELEHWLNTVMTFQTSVTGTFNIYDYDCGGDPVVTLSGRYGIYSYEGLVAFIRWPE